MKCFSQSVKDTGLFWLRASTGHVASSVKAKLISRCAEPGRCYRSRGICRFVLAACLPLCLRSQSQTQGQAVTAVTTGPTNVSGVRYGWINVW